MWEWHFRQFFAFCLFFLYKVAVLQYVRSITYRYSNYVHSLWRASICGHLVVVSECDDHSSSKFRLVELYCIVPPGLLQFRNISAIMDVLCTCLGLLRRQTLPITRPVPARLSRCIRRDIHLPSLAVMIGSCFLYCVKVRTKYNLMMNTIWISKYFHAWLVYRWCASVRAVWSSLIG